MKKYFFLVCVALLFAEASASAATFIVTNTNDSGTGSLRNAIGQANVALELDNSTVSDNAAPPTRTGGLAFTAGPTDPPDAPSATDVIAPTLTAPTLTLVSSILANNSGSGGDVSTSIAQIPTFTINETKSLIEVASSGNLLAIDPVLAPLAFNEGATISVHAWPIPNTPVTGKTEKPRGLPWLMLLLEANTVANTVALSGTVSAPGGSIASNQPTILKRFFAKPFLADALASPPGTSPVGSGITVNLIEIDSAGAQVGPIIATAITDANGNYILNAPEGFVPASKYVVRAVGAAKMDAFVTGTSNVDVDPYSDATVTLITGNAGNNIANISLADIDAVTDTIIGSSADVSTVSTTADKLKDDLTAVVLNDEEGNNIVASQSAQGGISGTVTDSNGTPLANIRIRVKTFGDQVTQAITRTDTNGQYKVHVPAGDYIVGAFNDTTASMAASEWWTSGGGTPSHKAADKVTIGTTEITRDFVLTAGCRIKGKITTLATGAALAGLNVVLVDFDSGIDFMSVRTHADGVYNFNVTPGNYFIAIRNSTLQPYATGLYNSAISGGGPTKSQAEKITLTAGDSIELNMSLLAGYKIEGTVTDPVSGPVAGVRIRFQDTATGITVEGIRTNRDASYRIWVRPGTYDVFSRGQIAAAVDVTSGNQTRNFNAGVGKITGVLNDATGNPVSQGNVALYDSVPTAYNYLGNEYSDADGSFTVYTIAPTASVIIEFKVDDGSMVGSRIYNVVNGVYARSGGTPVAAPLAGNTTSLGTISLPAGAVLTGIVTKGGQPAHSKTVQIRYGGGSTAGGTYRFVNTSTVFDGSYSISLPAGITFSRVCVFDQPGATTASACTSTVLMGAAGSTKPQNFAY